MEAKKIKSFTQLIVWKQAHILVIDIYKITRKFPKEETFSLIDQMKRSAISITSNIAEGFSRKGKSEKCQFYFTSIGSLTELQNQLLVAKDVGYISSDSFHILAEQTISIHKLLNSLIRSCKSKPKNILDSKY